MKKALMICYPKCSTCKKAKAWLEERGIAVEQRDIKENRPNEQELKEWIQKSELPLKRFFNTSGMAYRALELKERLPLMSEEEQIALLASDGMLVKPPILLYEGKVLVGFRQAEWEQKIN